MKIRKVICSALALSLLASVPFALTAKDNVVQRDVDYMPYVAAAGAAATTEC